MRVPHGMPKRKNLRTPLELVVVVELVVHQLRVVGLVLAEPARLVLGAELDRPAVSPEPPHALVEALLEGVGAALGLVRTRQPLATEALERQVAEQGICKGERKNIRLTLHLSPEEEQSPNTDREGEEVELI